MIYGLKDSLLAASWVKMGWKQEWKHGDHSEGQCSCPGEQWIKVVIKKVEEVDEFRIHYGGCLSDLADGDEGNEKEKARVTTRSLT